jgi:predicted MFS family arabinose efflux permease
LVSLTVAIMDGAPTALLLAAILIIAAALLFVLATPRNRTRASSSSQPSKRSRSWLNTVRPLALVYTVAALCGVATGMTTVALPAVTQAAGLAAVAGIAFAASAIGEVGGALIFGSRRWPLSERHQLGLALLAESCFSALVFIVSRSPWLLVPVIGIGGAIGAPVSIRLSSVLDTVTKPESLGLAYAVLVSAGLTAAAVGTSLAGQLTTWLQPQLLLLGPPILLLLATTAVVSNRSLAR